MKLDEAARFKNNLGLALNSSKDGHTKDEILDLNTRLLDLLDHGADRSPASALTCSPAPGAVSSAQDDSVFACTRRCVKDSPVGIKLKDEQSTAALQHDKEKERRTRPSELQADMDLFELDPQEEQALIESCLEQEKVMEIEQGIDYKTEPLRIDFHLVVKGIDAPATRKGNK